MSWRRRSRVEADRATVMLATVAAAATTAVVAGEVARVWRRGSAPPPHEAPDLLVAAEEAVVETAEVARAGHAEGSTRENATFNLLSSFVTTFALARVTTYFLRERDRVGPFRNLRLGRRRIHHFVPG